MPTTASTVRAKGIAGHDSRGHIGVSRIAVRPSRGTNSYGDLLGATVVDHLKPEGVKMVKRGTSSIPAFIHGCRGRLTSRSCAADPRRDRRPSGLRFPTVA